MRRSPCVRRAVLRNVRLRPHGERYPGRLRSMLISRVYDRAGSDLPFPRGGTVAVLAFETDEITVGRRSESRGITPDVDLSDELVDPGVSHTHAIIRRDSVSDLYSVTDLGSTNGTTINGDEQQIDPHQPVPLKTSDRIHVGAWTTIRIIG